MKDAEVIEAMARACFQSHWPKDKWERFKPEDYVCEQYRAMAQAAYSICAPAIRERCAAVCDVTPLSDACAAAIRALSLPTPHDGITDTSHHAVRPFCPCCGGKMRLTSAGKFGCDDCCVYWSESELAERGSSAGESEEPSEATMRKAQALWVHQGIQEPPSAPAPGRPQGCPPGPIAPPLGSNNVRHHYRNGVGGRCRECSYPADEMRMHFAASPAPPHQGGAPYTCRCCDAAIWSDDDRCVKCRAPAESKEGGQ